MISDAPDGVVIDLKVIPRAGRTMLAGTRGDALLIRLAAAPVDGAANAELIAFLSTVLAVSQRQISVVAGERTRSKRVQVRGLDARVGRARIEAHGGK